MTRTTTTRRAFAATVAVGLAAGLLAAASPALAKPNGPKPNKPPKPAKNSVVVVTSAMPCPAGLSTSDGVTSRVVISDDGTTAVLRIRGTQKADTIVAAPPPLPAGVTLAKVVIHGYRGDDTICGLTDVANRIYGLGGNDDIYGGSKVDALFGGTGADDIWGNGDTDKVITGAGQDNVWVFAGSRVNGKVYPLPTT